MAYYEKHYDSSFKEFPDEIKVYKSKGDWTEVTMKIHDEQVATFTLRSKNMVQALIFMLQQAVKDE